MPSLTVELYLHGSCSSRWEIQVAREDRVWVFQYVRDNYPTPSLLTSKWTGEIYLAQDILLQKNVVIKLEPLKGKYRILEHEFHVYKKLRGGIGIPGVRWFGIEAGFNAMVMDRLGQSLDALFVNCNFQFTLKTVLLLAGQLVSGFNS